MAPKTAVASTGTEISREKDFKLNFCYDLHITYKKKHHAILFFFSFFFFFFEGLPRRNLISCERDTYRLIYLLISIVISHMILSLAQF